MSRPNPLTDELPEDVKAELAVVFQAMRARCRNFDVEEQRFMNRVWNLRDYRLP